MSTPHISPLDRDMKLFCPGNLVTVVQHTTVAQMVIVNFDGHKSERLG